MFETSATEKKIEYCSLAPEIIVIDAVSLLCAASQVFQTWAYAIIDDKPAQS